MIRWILNFLWFDSFVRLFKKEGFNFIELLTTVGIAGVLSVVGIKSYQSQTNKARSAEAKHSLSYVYTAEVSFKDSWDTYHENLLAIGAIPSGSYHYDVGFSYTASLSDSDGSLGRNYPETDLLTVRECTNFKNICDGDCISSTVSAVPGLKSYFLGYSTNCEVASPLYFEGQSKAGTDAKNKMAGGKASGSAFKALATGRLRSDDIWSIDQSKTVIHEVDGTQ